MNDILQDLIAEFGRQNVIETGKRAKIRCPFHSGGNEKTPSLTVNLTEPYLGRGLCFACNWTGTLDEVLGRTPKDVAGARMFTERIKIKQEEQETNPAAFVDPDFNNWPLWPKKKMWRTIPGWLINDLGGRIETTEYGKRLALPVVQFKENRGLIHCSLYKSELAYIYDKHKFIKSSMFPYDYTKRLLQKSRTGTLFIVEGPRDTCKMLTYNLPTLGNLGGITIWNQQKAELIEMLNPKQMIIATDPDKVGTELFHAIQESCPHIKSRRLRFEIKHDKAGKVSHKADPGNMSEMRLNYLQQHFG